MNKLVLVLLLSLVFATLTMPAHDLQKQTEDFVEQARKLYAHRPARPESRHHHRSLEEEAKGHKFLFILARGPSGPWNPVAADRLFPPADTPADQIEAKLNAYLALGYGSGAPTVRPGAFAVIPNPDKPLGRGAEGVVFRAKCTYGPEWRDCVIKEGNSDTFDEIVRHSLIETTLHQRKCFKLKLPIIAEVARDPARNPLIFVDSARRGGAIADVSGRTLALKLYTKGTFEKTINDNPSRYGKGNLHRVLKATKRLLGIVMCFHESQVIHRDIKLENLLTMKGTATDFVVADFGVACKNCDEDDPACTDRCPGFAATPLSSWGHWIDANNPKDNNNYQDGVKADLYGVATSLLTMLQGTPSFLGSWVPPTTPNFLGRPPRSLDEALALVAGWKETVEASHGVLPALRQSSEGWEASRGELGPLIQLLMERHDGRAAMREVDRLLRAHRPRHRRTKALVGAALSRVVDSL